MHDKEDCSDNKEYDERKPASKRTNTVSAEDENEDIDDRDDELYVMDCAQAGDDKNYDLFSSTLGGEDDDEESLLAPPSKKQKSSRSLTDVDTKIPVMPKVDGITDKEKEIALADYKKAQKWWMDMKFS